LNCGTGDIVNCFVWNAHWKKPLTGRGKYTMQEREMDTKKVMMMRIGHNDRHQPLVGCMDLLCGFVEVIWLI